MADTIFDWLKRNGISFSDRRLILEALTHSSYVNEHKEAGHDEMNGWNSWATRSCRCGPAAS